MLKRRKQTLSPSELEFAGVPVGTGGLLGVPDAKRLETLKVSDIKTEKQVRRSISPDELKELAESIEREGLIQPIVVSELEDGKYLLVAGHRRFFAVKDILGWQAVPAIVIPPVSERKRRLLQLHENYQRRDLTVGEIAELAGLMLMEKLNMSRKELTELLSGNGFCARTPLIKDDSLRDAFMSLSKELSISPTMLSAYLWFFCLPDELRQQFDDSLTVTSVSFMCDAGINPVADDKEELKKWLSMASETSSKQFRKLLSQERPKRKRARKKDILTHLEGLDRIIAKSADELKSNEHLKEAVIDKLKELLQKLQEL